MQVLQIKQIIYFTERRSMEHFYFSAMFTQDLTIF